MTRLEDALAAFDPAVTPPAVGGGDVRFVLDDTALGRMLLAARSDGTLVASVFAADDAAGDRALQRLARTVSPRILRGGPLLDPARRQLEEYLAGRRHAFDLPFDLALATGFQRAVLGGLAEHVGYGRTTSYGELARLVGRPRAARAVGAALGANPLCVVLPCHRVVGSTGALTGYAGGPAAKERLLSLERLAAAR